MKRAYFFIALSCCLLLQAQKPKLVVGIVIDQMRAEYLDRFSNDFEEDGFKRLVNNGYNFRNMHFNYMPTYTAPGHASIYTGTTPSDHGIVGNDWYHRAQKAMVYCTEDSNYQTIGEESDAGEMSPNNLLASTITDELKLFSNQESKVFGVSVKDRGAILPAGHFADAAYWLSDDGNFVSSSYYFKALPKWVSTFNSKKHVSSYLKEWQLLKPLRDYTESGSDNSPYEAPITGEKPVFPYVLEGSEPSTIKSTPFGNDLLWDFTQALIEQEDLGKDDVTDFLAISFSSTDYIGHRYGVHSKEIQDTYIRLDRTLAKMLNYLDSKLGKNNYVLFLTADHAAAENPPFLKSLRYPIEPLSQEKVMTDIEVLKKKVAEKFGVDALETIYNQNIYLDHQALDNKGVHLKEVVDFLLPEIEKLPYVKHAYDAQYLETHQSSYSNYMDELSRGIMKERSGDIVVLFQPGQFIMHYGETGTTHGSPYNYDTHVPCIFYGNGIPKGESYDRKVITQISGTLSALLKIPFANAADTQLLTEILD